MGNHLAWLPLILLIMRRTTTCSKDRYARPQNNFTTKFVFTIFLHYLCSCKSEKPQPKGLTIHRGMEQLVARRAHNPKVVWFESHSRYYTGQVARRVLFFLSIYHPESRRRRSHSHRYSHHYNRPNKSRRYQCRLYLSFRSTNRK